ncbi:EAL domain-containing protein [Marinicella sp. S1101]|uniref:bifunctional diguanylate cyclase/phosphodiesterase n=1 Tax=Marinicella marina TaxID=2996016 RepID=UPI002260BF91|nr:EAL domain-containing protein [Marinicella marina]MCX7552410.1 EAL domain-containing protein [Marinicella marina]MDJ1139285.1 EAL domain-containing protein [Marinicella marina]
MKNWPKWIGINIIIGCVFAAFCYVASQYMIRPTLSISIWPAAGLGVGVILIWGKKAIPGIMLGEILNSIILYNIHIDFGWDKSSLYDVLLLLNNFFRPIFAGMLARHVMGHAPHLVQVKDILKFFTFGALIPCFISTVIFVILLSGAGFYGADDFFSKGVLWYLGDIMSVLIFTPILMSFFARPRRMWQPRIFNVALPILAGFIMVFLLFNSFKGYEERRINELVKTHLNYIIHQSQSQATNYQAMVDFIETEAEAMNLDDFKISIAKAVADGYEIEYQSKDVVTRRYDDYSQSALFSVNGERFELSIVPTPAYFNRDSTWGLWLTLLIALAFTGFIGVGMLALTGRHVIVAREVKERTLQLNMINRQLQERNSDYQRIIENQPVIFWKVDMGLDKVTFVSQEAEAILGYSIDQWLNEPHFFSNKIHHDDLTMVKDTMHSLGKKRTHGEIEYRILHADGQYRWFRDVLNKPDDEDVNQVIMGMLIDITAEKNDAEKIHHLAFHDYLTQLPNRQQFQNVLNQLIIKGLDEGHYGAMLFLDMDRFKVLNDALGHHFGDQLLLKIAARLKSFQDDFKVMARFGGDEFVLATDCDYQNQNDAAVQIIMLAEKIITRLAEPYNINNQQHVCTVSMGISVYPFEQATVNDVIRQADVAMYRSKEQGRNQVTMYHTSMKKENDKMLYVEQVLRNAVSNDSFILKYQPIVNVEREIICFESLIRIFNEQQTMFPDDFIPVAEDTDLIQPVGRWVISNACLKIMDCHHNVSVNVSSKQFHQQGFIKYIEQILKRFNVGEGRLTIELTEGVVVGNLNEIQYKFQRLKEMGVLIAIDDFGTGYSSLEYLRQLPIDYLKIDKSFVTDLNNDESSRVIIETIISMAKHLNLQTVAEGVETEEQFTVLKQIGCDLFQGYLFGKPGDFIINH